MRFINELYTAPIGDKWSNERLLPVYQDAIGKLSLDDAAREELQSFVRFQLVGERSRRTVVPEWAKLLEFKSRAQAYERGVEAALDALTPQIAASVEQAGVTFDAVLTTTSTGNLMPGVSYRLARRL